MSAAQHDTAATGTPTYAELWDAFHAGALSTTVMVALLKADEVFAAYCKRRVRLAREARDADAAATLKPAVTD